MRQRLTNQVYSALENVIVKGTSHVPFVKPDEPEIINRVNDLSRGSYQLRAPADFFDTRLPITVLDRVAGEQTRRAQAIVVTSGAGSSTVGLLGLAIDMPILVATTAGLVRRHALTYGFTEIEEAGGDAVPLLTALGVAVGAEITIGQLTPRLAQWVGVDVGTKLVERYLMKRISQQLAADIIAHWLPRAVPFIGVAAAAALDYAFLSMAGRRTAKHYREQHLLVRAQAAVHDGGRAAIDQILTTRRLRLTSARSDPAAPPASADIIDAEFTLSDDPPLD